MTTQQRETALRHAREHHVAEREGGLNAYRPPYLWPAVYVTYDGMIGAYTIRFNTQLKTSLERK